MKSYLTVLVILFVHVLFIDKSYCYYFIDQKRESNSFIKNYYLNEQKKLLDNLRKNNFHQQVIVQILSEDNSPDVLVAQIQRLNLKEFLLERMPVLDKETGVQYGFRFVVQAHGIELLKLVSQDLPIRLNYLGNRLTRTYEEIAVTLSEVLQYRIEDPLVFKKISNRLSKKLLKSNKSDVLKVKVWVDQGSLEKIVKKLNDSGKFKVFSKKESDFLFKIHHDQMPFPFPVLQPFDFYLSTFVIEGNLQDLVPILESNEIAYVGLETYFFVKPFRFMMRQFSKMLDKISKSIHCEKLL